MPLRFRKIIRLAPGLRINLSKSGASLSVGGKGATVNLGRKGARSTFGLPGSGVSHSSYVPYREKRLLPWAVVLLALLLIAVIAVYS